MKSGHQTFKLRQVVLAALSALTAVTFVQAADQGDVVRRVEVQVGSAEKVIRSDTAQEKDLLAVQSELQKLLTAVNEEVSAIGGEENPDSPVIKAHSRLTACLAAIDARLPHHDSSPGTTRLGPLPVPQYDEKKIVGRAARELVAAQQKLADHLRNTKGTTAETSKLLADLIQAQENLAWELGWPFTSEEADAIKKADGLTPEVYLSRRNRGVEQISRHLQQDLQSSGRETTGSGFVIYSPAAEADLKEVELRLVKQRGAAVKDIWRKDTTPFDADAFRQLAGAR
jgi:hypothetical protein